LDRPSNGHALEEFANRTVLARLAAFNIVRHPYPIAIPYENEARYEAKLEPPEQYNHPYNRQVEERVVPVAEARTLCMSMGADLLGVACSWQSNGICYIVLPNDEYAPVATFRRHEIAHCNGWPANHPRDG
jgi:hypothetical protein